MKYVCSCGFASDDLNVFIGHVFKPEYNYPPGHYILFQEDQTNRARCQND